MTTSQPTMADRPGKGYRWYRAEKAGFAVAVPRRLEPLAAAVDPVARMLLDGGRAAADGLPPGFYDPEVVAVRRDGSRRPLRLLEFATLDIRAGDDDSPRPLTAGAPTAGWLRLDARIIVPPLLDALRLPGFEPLGVQPYRLGAHDAVGFEYTWHGFAEGRHGLDRGLLLWWRGLEREFHVYYHCPQKEWDKWTDELEAVLATFVAL